MSENEYGNYNQSATKKRSVSDKSLDDGNIIINYLNDKFKPNRDIFTLKQYTYQALLDGFNNDIYNKEQIIIQIKDKPNKEEDLEYIRYAKLVSLDNDEIHLTSERKNITYTRRDFNKMYIEDDGNFVVVFVPSQESISGNTTASVLKEIVSYQMDRIDHKIDVANGFIGGCGILASMGIVFMLSGYFQCCDFCKVRAVTASGEAASLLKGYGHYYAYSLDPQIANQEMHVEHPICRNPYRIAMVGLFITIGSAATIITSLFLIKNYYIPEKDNLRRY
jgi:hypothetical protein